MERWIFGKHTQSHPLEAKTNGEYSHVSISTARESREGSLEPYAAAPCKHRYICEGPMLLKGQMNALILRILNFPPSTSSSSHFTKSWNTCSLDHLNHQSFSGTSFIL